MLPAMQPPLAALSTPLAAIRAFLVDLDGTTYLGDRLLPGAADFFGELRRRQVPFRLFSNNPTQSAADYAAKLTGLGIPVAAAEVITSTAATVHHLADQGLTRLYVLGTPSFEQELVAAGALLTADEPQAVVVSFDTTLTYEKLKQAALLLQQKPELPFIATNPDLVCPTPEGPIPDCGSIVALLTAATGRTPEYMGKPNGGMVHLACHQLGLAPTNLAVIGDRLYTDMAMGRRHGLTTVLVLTGETTTADLTQAEWKPDHVYADLAAVRAALKSES
jgi:HAD superfamily hydrolase (TIGR01450 family)